MKKILFPIAIFAAVTVSSCVKENMVEPAEQGKTVLTAGIEAKTVLQNDAQVLWTSGDKINVNGVESAALELDAAAAVATFTFDAVLETPYMAVFPSSIYKDATTVTLPAYQSYTAGSFGKNAAPMAAVSDNSNLQFNNLCAVLKVTVNKAADSDHAKVAYVDFSGKAGEQVSGDFAIDFTTMTLTGASNAEADKKVRYSVSKTIGEEAFVMYIVVPAGEYAQGYTLRILDAEGHYMDQSKNSAQTLQAGKVYELPAFDFVPTGTELDVEIATAQDLIKFATDYNAGAFAGDDLLVASLSQDITFDAESSAAFAATGGIGTAEGPDGETNYFNGFFNGNEKAIKGYVGNVPLFAYTGSEGNIHNLTFDETCTLTVNAPAPDTYHGLLVGRHKGEVKNCTSYASVVINNLEDSNTATQYYGGLVGRNYGGKISGSLVTGNITCSQSGVTLSKNNVSIGGIAGGQADEGSISDCDFHGNITISDGEQYGGITAVGKYFYVAGIVGYVDNGVISDCVSGAENVATAIDVRGILVPALGGIASWVKEADDTEISGCVNYMSFSFASSGGRADTTPCRIGGIVARSAADILQCSNYGPISTVCNSTSIYLAGIVSDGANVSNCTNNATGTITRTNQVSNAQANRYVYIGGIMGAVLASCDVDHCTNNANLLNTNPGSATNATIDMGGILGTTSAAEYKYQVDITNCTNTGNVTAQETTANKLIPARTAVGGILGYSAAPSTTITDCNNSGYIYTQYNGANTGGRCSYTGGIAGLMGTSAAGVAGLEIGNCDNTGIVYSRNYNNTVTLAGGAFGGSIVGAINGTADSKANVHDCTASTQNLNCYRGINGGIAGYAGNATLTANAASQTINPNSNVEGNGGVVGWAVGTSISDCSFSGTSTAAKNVAGLVYLMDGTSSITNCKVDGATLAKGANAAAVLVCNAAAGATITNCGVKGTLDGAAITLGSNMITTDGGATVTGTYLLD